MNAAMDSARAVADAVLYEGYLLYPYRASAAKNQVRWQWGVLMPPAFVASGTGEHSDCQAELLVEPAPGATLHSRLRFLQAQDRVVQQRDGAVWRDVPAATIEGTEYTSWQEAVEHDVDAVLRFADLVAVDNRVRFDAPGGEDAEPLGDGARLVRRRRPLHGELRLRADRLPGPYGGYRLHLVLRNTSTWPAVEADRDAALAHALIAAHLLVSVSAGGGFLSLLEPPEWATAAARGCENDRLWPVLVGEPGQRDTALCSPIILYDYPAVAEQSPGDLFDATEIDEILTLRTMVLTDEEKRQARATDARAAQLVDRVDGMPPELLERLHGTVRYLRDVTSRPGREEPADVTARPDVPWWDPGADASVSPETDSVMIDGVPVRKGSRVRLRPRRRADAHDMFLAGREADVEAVLLDVDGERHLAVTLADDPGADLYAQHGRFRYFGTDEVEPL